MSQGKKYSEAKKQQVLEELKQAGCVAKNLAKLHGMSISTVKKWRQNQQKAESRFKAVTELDVDNKFIELSVNKPGCQSSDSRGTDLEFDLKRRTEGNNYNLEKASLVFSDFSIFIEGNFSRTKIISIIKILDESC